MTKVKAIEILNQRYNEYVFVQKLRFSDESDIVDRMIALLTAIDALEQDSSVEAEPEKQDTQLSVILQDFGIDNAEQLRYILEQYQKVIEEITGGQMSYLTYPAQAVIECANDRYLSALADLKEDE